MKTILITGGTGTIGYYCSQKFADKGYNVISIGTNIEKLDKLSENKNITTFNINLTKNNEIDKLSNLINHIDIILNCIGGTIYGDYISIDEIDEEKIYNTLNLNLISPLLIIKKLINKMEKKGSIINIGSISYKINFDNILYSSSKMYFNNITKFLSKEKKINEKNIRVNIINPGAISENGKMEGLNDKFVGKPEDIFNIILFLADYNKSKFINGQSINITGGLENNIINYN